MAKYVRWGGRNFGDDLNDMLFRDVLGIREYVNNAAELKDDVFVIGIGTILNGFLRQGANSRLLVFGSGAGNSREMPKILAEVLFVRGPLSCDFLKIDKNAFITDGAYALADRIRELAKGTAPRYEYGLIPHHWSLEQFPNRWSASDDVQMISPHSPCEEFIRRVAGCRKIVTECLHGAITADILGIPFAVIQTTPMFHSFKWLDWAASLQMNLVLNYVDLDVAYSASFGRLHFANSPDTPREDAIRRTAEKLEELRGFLALR